MERSTLGSAMLAGDEQCRSQVNAFLLGLMHNHTRDEPRHTPKKNAKRRRQPSKTNKEK
jgi:hypothetical protein